MDADEFKAMFEQRVSFDNVDVQPGEMSPRERFFAIMEKKPFDRMIDHEFGYWNETLRRWHALKTAASEAIIAAGGTISHQHGIGLDHAPYLTAEKGALGVAALQTLCKHFDPGGIMNPGKLIVE